MKLLLTILPVWFSYTVFAQLNSFSGDYNRTFSKEDDHLMEYKLTLYQDGTFVFHSYSKIKMDFHLKSIQSEKGNGM